MNTTSEEHFSTRDDPTTSYVTKLVAETYHHIKTLSGKSSS